jgi:uncharacterized protein (DUF488 family)
LQKRIYTIGHGNKGLEELVGLLKAYCIQTLVDIRSYPGSKRNPHFNREVLEMNLPRAGIAYLWFKGLGGFRKSGLGSKSPHVALKSQGFRNYADYMLTKTFKQDIDNLLCRASIGRTCMMCAETLPFKCHRWLLSDYLVTKNVQVIHVMAADKTARHRLSRHARVQGGSLFYDLVDEQRDNSVQQPIVG